MDQDMRIKCKTLLEKTLNKLFLTEYNQIIVETELLKDLSNLTDNGDCLKIYNMISTIKHTVDPGQREECIERLRNLSYKGLKLYDLFEITEKDNKICIRSKTDLSFRQISKEFQEYLIIKQALDLNLADYCKNLFTLYETFYSELSKVACFLYPDEFLKEEGLTFNDLKMVDFEKEAILKLLTEKLTYGLTQRSTKLEDVCEFLKLDKSSFNQLKDNFTEIYYRRNAFTHGEGLLTNDYKKFVRSDLQKKYVKENRLIFTKDYKDILYETIVLIIFQLFINTVYKNEVSNEDLAMIETYVFKIFYVKKKWKISKVLYGYLRHLKFADDCAYKPVFTVNYLCCLKALNEEAELKKQLKAFNVSSMSKEYKLAKNLILENYDNINQQIEDIYCGTNQKAGYVCTEDIMTWPLYQDYIKTEDFKQFRERHANDFKTYITE